MYANPNLLVDAGQLDRGHVCFAAPSNIALIKYWGKHGRQLPRNPNASFTLTVARTITELGWAPRGSDDVSPVQLRLYFDGEERPEFAGRIQRYLHSLREVYPFTAQFAWTVRTRNTFPHGAGIASSASAFAAIAACLTELEARWFEPLGEPERRRKSSYLARLGSGSAGRSVFAKAAAWGESSNLPGSSDEYAVPLEDALHGSFADYQDSILLVSEAEKAVSSSAGHGLMDQHPYADERYRVATRRFERLLEVLRRGELDDFCTLVEADALDLHALMMQSTPPYLLIRPGTLALIEAVRRFRENTKLPVCFTLDAGPNVHLLYPKSITAQVDEWLESKEVAQHFGARINDHVGGGPAPARLLETVRV